LEYVGVFVEVDPFVGAHGDVGVGCVFVMVLDDVDVLDTEAVAAAQDGTGVVGLEDVFEDDADVACAVEDEFVEELAFVGAEELGGGFVELFALGEGEGVEDGAVGVVDFGHGVEWYLGLGGYCFCFESSRRVVYFMKV
jgi:hypothetical protein